MRKADEHRQVPGSEPLWADVWSFDFWRPDGLGAFVRLALYPNLATAWWWAYVLTERGVVAVRDHDVPVPRTGIEIRTDGLWADLICETPWEHWTIGLEAFAVRFDDPAEAWGAEWGDRLPVGLDLEWEETGPPAAGKAPGPAAPAGEGGSYGQPGRVHGEILVGPERIPFDGFGYRGRSWGLSDWWSAMGTSHQWAAYRTDRGHSVAFRVPGDGGAEAVRLDSDPASGLPRSATYAIGGQRVEATLLGAAPVLVTGPDGRRARLGRALCRFDGESGGGHGWAEWLLG